jgi:Rieske Fe-S protein
MQIERRKFISSACKACLFTGAGFVLSDLIACSPTTKIIRLPVIENTVSLPVSSFSKTPVQIIIPEGWLYNIAVRKTTYNQFEALLLQCTHQQNQLIAGPNGYICTLHGSRFNREGQVQKGPAALPLKKYSTVTNQDLLIIHLNA